MAYIGTFTSGQILTASELNSPAAMCVLTTTTGQNYTTATAAVMTFVAGDEKRDPEGWFTAATSSSRIVPTVSGIYLFDACVVFANNSGTGAYLEIRKNGTVIARTAADLSGTGGQSALSASVSSDANGTTDYFDVNVYQNSGGTVATTLKNFSAIRMSL